MVGEEVLLGLIYRDDAILYRAYIIFVCAFTRFDKGVFGKVQLNKNVLEAQEERCRDCMPLCLVED